MDDETTTMRAVRVSGGTRRRRRMRRADPDMRVLRRCRTLMLAITPMWWIMWGVFLASATMPATMRAGIGLIVLTAGLLAPAPIIRYTRETGKRRGRPASKEWNPT
ncbi:hypothetical protein [Bifidobacterium longum]|uniref:hypothetical protein n=1 Tax=Bifidobacterium longum TaxID=216816 RepID=UPI0035621354